jgi:glyoxylase I family protein
LSPYLRHVVLVVSSLETSLRFYRGLLEPLGWTELTEYTGERGQRTCSIWGPGGAEMPSVQLREKLSDAHGVPYDRFAVGIHHLAFDAPSREAVDERARWLRETGARIESGPAEYAYTAGYYAVFFYDPDGIKLEIVHKPVHQG